MRAIKIVLCQNSDNINFDLVKRGESYQNYLVKYSSNISKVNVKQDEINLDCLCRDPHKINLVQANKSNRYQDSLY
jgi:hypothetical protein